MNIKRRQRGVALVEFALILPLLIILSAITTEYGRALYEYNIVTKSVRDASRYLSIQDPSIVTTEPAKITIAKNLVVYGKPSGSSSPLTIGLNSLDQVEVPTWSTAGANPTINTVTVTVRGCGSSEPPCFKFVPLFASLFGAEFGEVNYADISATMRAPL